MPTSLKGEGDGFGDGDGEGDGWYVVVLLHVWPSSNAITLTLHRLLVFWQVR